MRKCEVVDFKDSLKVKTEDPQQHDLGAIDFETFLQFLFMFIGSNCNGHFGKS